MSCVSECVSVCLCKCDRKRKRKREMKKLIPRPKISDVQTKTARQPDSQAASQVRDKDKSKRGWWRRGWLSVDLASGASRHTGRQSNGQVRQPNRQKEVKCLRKTNDTELSKATHSY